MKKYLLKIGWILLVFSVFISCSDSEEEEADPCASGPVLSVDNVRVSIEGQSTGEISVSATSGQAPLMYSIDGINFQNDGSFTNLEADDYNVTVKDANNCTDTQMVTVAEVQEVSYADQIRPIIDTNCQLSNCHGDNISIPSFETYQDVQANASGIKFRTSGGTMPPSGPLPEAEVKLIADWVDQGAPNN